MILAGVMHYVHWWQAFPVLGFLAAWLVAGPYLTSRALTKYGVPRTQRRLPDCMRMNFLTSLAGLVAMGIVVLFAAVLAAKLGEEPDPQPPAVLNRVRIAGFLVGLLAMLGMSWAVQATMLDLSGKDLRGAVLYSVGPLVLTLLVCCLVALIPARIIRLRQSELARCEGRLLAIQTAVEKYAARHFLRQAPSIEAMVEEGMLEKGHIWCPSRGKGECGYLYAPVAPDPNGLPKHKMEIRACDRRGNHGDIRVVLYSSGLTGAVTEEGFQQLLTLPFNADIAAKDKAEQ